MLRCCAVHGRPGLPGLPGPAEKTTLTDSTDPLELFEETIALIIGDGKVSMPKCGVDVSGALRTGRIGEETRHDVARNLNAAFLIKLSGARHPRFKEADSTLDSLGSDPLWGSVVTSYGRAAELIRTEFLECSGQGDTLERAKEFCCLASASNSKAGAKTKTKAGSGSGPATEPGLQEALFSLFCPEAAGLSDGAAGLSPKGEARSDGAVGISPKGEARSDGAAGISPKGAARSPKGAARSDGGEALSEVQVPPGPLVEDLRKKRAVTLNSLNPAPVGNVPREVLFTANALLTVPPPERPLIEEDFSPALREALKEVACEDQLFWYDHPVQIGVEPEKNEILYGLEHLKEALSFEKKAGTVSDDAELTCVLSVSVTHQGLQSIAKEYVEHELEKSHELTGLNVFLFTEASTARLIGEVLEPAARRYMPLFKDPRGALSEVVGVDGRYGRHFSFLKAVSALWQVFVDPEIKATFKFDLDQVFPEEELKKETGLTAFEHLKSPLWGADGTDSEGQPVHLGMLAGALVNERDIGKSLFTPDVDYPRPPFKGEDSLFLSKLPQALSTEAEMMARYGAPSLDGEKKCLSRVHVTGGTTGITVASLRKYRPFTPVFINRAEDQAYLLSVLFSGEADTPPLPSLRYLHKDGLIMRHDKEAFATEAIKAAAIGKLIGDYERLILFSYYACALPWDMRDIKAQIDPFTGCFVSRLPFTVAYLRLALKAAALFESADDNDDDGDRARAHELIETGLKRLDAATEEALSEGSDGLREKYLREKAAWDLFYDTLDKLEEALKKNDPFALELKDKALSIIGDVKVAL